jgi:hypothetical protein
LFNLPNKCLLFFIRNLSFWKYYIFKSSSFQFESFSISFFFFFYLYNIYKKKKITIFLRLLLKSLFFFFFWYITRGREMTEKVSGCWFFFLLMLIEHLTREVDMKWHTFMHPQVSNQTNAWSELSRVENTLKFQHLLCQIFTSTCCVVLHNIKNFFIQVYNNVILFTV